MTVRPNACCCETWIVSIGVTASPCHAPSRSRIRRLACESASGRNAARVSVLPRIPTFRCESWSASASAQPTGPAPRIRTSISCAGIAHQRFDLGYPLGRFGGDDLAVALRHDYIVLDPDADVAQGRRDIVGGADIEAGLDCKGHSRLERAPLPGALVFAGIVHVESQPVARAVHVEALVGLLLQDLVESR